MPSTKLDLHKGIYLEGRYSELGLLNYYIDLQKNNLS